METDIEQDYALALAVYNRLRYADPETPYGVLQKTVIEPHLSDLGVNDACENITAFLSPESQIDYLPETLLIRPGQLAEKPSLRSRVFPKATTYPETGSQANRELARILNKLAQISSPAPAVDCSAPVVHLPRDPSDILKEEHAQEKQAALSTHKADMLRAFKHETLRALFSGNYHLMDQRTRNELHWFESNVEGGQDLAKAITRVIGDLGTIGNNNRYSASFETSLSVLKAIRGNPEADACDNTLA